MPSHPDLTGSDPGLPTVLNGMLGRVRRIEVLRETRVLRGFTRVRDGILRLSDGKELPRRTPLPPSQDWLSCQKAGPGAKQDCSGFRS